MDIINAYFEKVVLLKVENKEGFSIYAAALNSSYGDGNKQYVLAFVPDHLSILEKAYLSDLQWENVQTRTLTNGYKLPTGRPMPAQKWNIPKGIENFMFSIKNRDDMKSRYTADGHPLELVLIHDPKKKSQYQYHNKTNLLAALMTFRCVISNTRTYIPGSLRGTPISSLKPQHDMKPPQREDSSRIEYKTLSGPLKTTIRYQSVSSAAQVNSQPKPVVTSSTTSPEGKGKNSMPLGSSKMVRQTNYPYPWTKGSIPGLQEDETGVGDTNSNIHFRGNEPHTTNNMDEYELATGMSPVGGFRSHTEESHFREAPEDFIDSSFDIIN